MFRIIAVVEATKTQPPGVAMKFSASLRSVSAAVAVGLGLLCGTLVHAQSYPSKPIRVIMPYPPGAGADLVLRMVTDKLAASLGQPFVVDYKPGASTIIASEALARSAPDGYTIGFVTDSLIINPIFKKLGYDARTDFAPITTLTDVPLVVATHPSVPAKNLQEFVAYAKANPGKLAYGSLGYGGPHYILVEWLKLLSGMDLLHVPYSGSAPALNAAIAGQVQLMLVGPAIGLQHAKTGRLNVIAVTPAKRLAAAPQIPSIAESGYKDFDFTAWYGMAAPGKTPPEIVTRLSQDIAKALRGGELEEKLLGLGLVPAPITPEEFAARWRRDEAYFSRVIKLTGARGE